MHLYILTLLATLTAALALPAAEVSHIQSFMPHTSN